MRLLRLAIGVYIIVLGVQSSEWIFIAMGGLFALMPLLNMGCGSSSGCNVPLSKFKKKSEDITYEEVH